MLAGDEVIGDQGTRRFAADENLVTHFDILQLRGQRAVRNLNAEKLELIFIVGAGQRICAQEGSSIGLLDAHHGEMPVAETECRIARRAKGEEGLVPVVHVQNGLGHQVTHAPNPSPRLIID